MPDWGFETRQIHSGAVPDPTTGARAVPIYQTTSYTFRDTAHAAALFGLEELGNIYTRIMNPTQAVFEERVAALEGGVAALAVASGQAAETITLLNLAENGGHIVSSASLYGGTYNLLHYTLPKLGDRDHLRRRSRRPRGLASRPSGPTPRPSTPRRSATRRATCSTSRASRRVAHEHKIPLVVDNTLATPYLAQPLPSRRRHRRALGHQVHRRPRDLHRRRHRRRWQLRLRGQRPVPELHRARPQLPRPGVRPAARGPVPRPVRPQGAAAVPPRHGPGRRAPQLVPVPAGPRDAEPAHGAPRAERHARWRSGSRPGTRCRGSPTPAWSPARGTQRQEHYLPKGGGAILAFGIAGGAEAGRTLHRGARAVQPPGQRGRRAQPGHPPGLDDALPADRGRADHGRRDARTWSACPSASSRSRTSWPISKPGSAPQRERERTSPTQACGGPGTSPGAASSPCSAVSGRAASRSKGGGRLDEVTVAYETWGTLDASADQCGAGAARAHR